MVSANAAGVLKHSMNDSLACIYTHMQLAMEEMHVVDWKIEIEKIEKIVCYRMIHRHAYVYMC